MKRLKQFNILCESIEIDLILESDQKSKIYKWLTKTWTLDEEFEALLPLIQKKIYLAFASFYESDKPGTPDTDGNPTIEQLDFGTGKPGFEVHWKLDEKWSKIQLLPYLLKDDEGEFSKLNNSYNLYNHCDDLRLSARIYVNTYGDEFDFSKKETIYVNKFQVPKWER